jgi:hypothetical protein
MSNLAKLQNKITNKAKQVAKKATKLIHNYSAISGESMSEHDRIVFDLKGYIVKPAVLKENEVRVLQEFDHINVRHHKPSIPPEVIEKLSPKHQRFFREVYHPQFDRF